MKHKGEISIFLVLILTVISAFITELAALERRYVSGSEAEYAVDSALRSCFAEYNRELFRRFHILLIDSSYKTSDSGTERLKSHFMIYLDGNTVHNDICSVDIRDYGNAGEYNYGYIYETVVEYTAENTQPDPRFSEQGDEALFLTYLMSVFGNCHDPVDVSVREGEIEYMLYGYESDPDNIRRAISEYEEQEDMEYEDYLCRQLEEVDPDILRQRFADLVTEYMCENGSPGFDLYTCYHDITVEALLTGTDSEEFGVIRRYAYEHEDS